MNNTTIELRFTYTLVRSAPGSCSKYWNLYENRTIKGRKSHDNNAVPEPEHWAQEEEETKQVWATLKWINVCVQF